MSHAELQAVIGELRAYIFAANRSLGWLSESLVDALSAIRKLESAVERQAKEKQ